MDKIQWLCGSTAPTGRECTLFVFSLDTRLTEIDILGVVEVEALNHLVSGELLQTSFVDMSELLMPQGVRVLACDAGVLADLTIEIIEASYSSGLGNQPPIRSTDLTATAIELSDLSSLSSLRDTQEVV